MSARRRAVAAALVLAALGAAALSRGAGESASLRRAPYPALFPPGNGHDVAERACLFCHSPMLVTQQAKDSAGWEKTIGQMEKWGAPITPAEHDSLRTYLLERFGPRVPPTPPK